jgi:DNA-binding GntR family transcriptional regulator
LPVPRESPEYRGLSDWVVRKILDAIRNGAIVPGDRLVEREVAERFGVSRAPVRDAIHRLEGLGIAERRMPRGVFVRPWTPEDNAELLSLNNVLILLSVQTGIDRLTEDDLAELDRLVAEGARLVDAGLLTYAEAEDLEIRFHKIIIRASGHRRLIELTDNLYLTLALYPREVYEYRDGRPWLQLHSSLLDTLKRRDHEAAVACVLRNAQDAEEVLKKVSHPGSSSPERDGHGRGTAIQPAAEAPATR